MTTIRTATSALLTEQIRSAKDTLIFVAPGVSETVAKALVDAHNQSRSVTIILDIDEEVCRIGYGEVNGFKYLIEHGQDIQLRKHSGLRLGLLIADKVVTVWSPTPRAVDGDRSLDQPNAIVIGGGKAENSTEGNADPTGNPNDGIVETLIPTEGTVTRSSVSLAEQLARRLGEEQLGQEQVRQEELREVVTELKENPPAPFDLARKVRVFSTRFQYVETELQGAEWTQRRIKLSSLLLNSDLPDALQDILETRVRPYGTKGDILIEVPCIVRGQIAYNEHREKILVPMNQRDIESIWKDIRDRYLYKVPGFGSLVRKRDLSSFRSETEAFECVLQDWVAQFRQCMDQDQEDLISNIVASIKRRAKQSDRSEAFRGIDLTAEVRSGLEGMRVIEPRVRTVIKDVSWESSRDQEFTSALREALPAEDLQGWFDEFVAVEERRKSEQRDTG